MESHNFTRLCVAQLKRWGMKSTAREYGREVEVVNGDSFGIWTWHVATTGCREGATRGHLVFVGAGSVLQAESDDSGTPWGKQ